MTRFLYLAAIAVVVAAPSTGQTTGQSAAATAEQPLKDLTGLWGAKKWFGPEVRGQRREVDLAS